MKIVQEKFHIETSLSEHQVEELLKKNVSNQMLALQYSGRDGFAGRLDPDAKEFKFVFFYRKAKCAVITGHYAVDIERGTTIYFDIRWPMFEALSFILGALGCVIVPYIFSAHFFVLSKMLLIVWPLVVAAFSAGSIGYYYVPGIKQARTKLIELFEPNTLSVVED